VTRVPDRIREQVQQRANGRCEYCHLPEEFGFYGHQVDHIITVKHRGNSLLSNLAWACFDCNNAKGSDIASYDENTAELTPLFNPRTQVWNDHFQLNGAEIAGKTSIGRVTVFLFQMNRDEQIETRRDLIDVGIW
jgi:5-methylcytosine-specific restriction endonuclease McrA